MPPVKTAFFTGKSISILRSVRGGMVWTHLAQDRAEEVFKGLGITILVKTKSPAFF
jgi:hypothetical protein